MFKDELILYKSKNKRNPPISFRMRCKNRRLKNEENCSLSQSTSRNTLKRSTFKFLKHYGVKPCVKIFYDISSRIIIKRTGRRVARSSKYFYFSSAKKKIGGVGDGETWRLASLLYERDGVEIFYYTVRFVIAEAPYCYLREALSRKLRLQLYFRRNNLPRFELWLISLRCKSCFDTPF